MTKTCEQRGDEATSFARKLGIPVARCDVTQQRNKYIYKFVFKDSPTLEYNDRQWRLGMCRLSETRAKQRMGDLRQHCSFLEPHLDTIPDSYVFMIYLFTKDASTDVLDEIRRLEPGGSFQIEDDLSFTSIAQAYIASRPVDLLRMMKNHLIKTTFEFMDMLHTKLFLREIDTGQGSEDTNSEHMDAEDSREKPAKCVRTTPRQASKFVDTSPQQRRKRRGSDTTPTQPLRLKISETYTFGDPVYSSTVQIAASINTTNRNSVDLEKEDVHPIIRDIRKALRTIDDEAITQRLMDALTNIPVPVYKDEALVATVPLMAAATYLGRHTKYVEYSKALETLEDVDATSV